MPEPEIHIQGLQVKLGGRCLLDVPALAIAQGERVALIGPNGAGKSLLLKVLGGFLPASQGQVTVLGRELQATAQRPMTPAEWRQWRAQVGQVLQGLHLVGRLTALDNVVLGALARPQAMAPWRSWLRCYPQTLVQEAQQALSDLGLAHRLHSRADQLSGGERQKASLARLRLQRPRLILADEPTSALDPVAAQQACEALNTIAANATLLTVVHDPALLPRLADRVIGLKAGQVRFDVPVGQLGQHLLGPLYDVGDPLNERFDDTGANLPLALPLRPRHISQPTTAPTA